MNFFETSFLPPQTRYSRSPPGEDYIDVNFDRIRKVDPQSDAHQVFQNDHGQSPDTRATPIIIESTEEPQVTVPPQDYEIEFIREAPFPHKIVLARGIHYNPQPTTPQGEELPIPPEWVIISSDPTIINLLPIDCGESRGLILYRGQVTIESGILVIHENTPRIPLSSREIERGLLDLRYFVGPNKPCQMPLRYNLNDPKISYIFNIAVNCLKQKIYINQTLINISNFWRNTNILTDHLIINNGNMNHENTLSSNHESILNQNSTNSTLVTEPNVQVHEINSIFETVTSNSTVVNHSVNPINETVTSNPMVYSHNIEPQY
ncbi:hypothetical protein GPJ56_008461 [Histomonas meleagridis]|nr:hypothetical protein GPJ56_008461 [Histomonas meleagridis]